MKIAGRFPFMVAVLAATFSTSLRLEGASAVDELRLLVAGSSRVEIRSRDRGWEQYGLPWVRKVFDGEVDVGRFVSAIDFQPQVVRVAEPGMEDIPMPNCGCDGQYEIVFFREGQIVATFTFHHGTHIRCPRFNDGRDAFLSDPTKAFLRQFVGIEEDVKKAEEVIQRRKTEANQALQTTSVTRSGFGKVSVPDRQRRGV